MAKQKKLNQEPIEAQSEATPEMEQAFKLIIKDGWFVVQKIEVPKNAKVIEETNPDIFPIFISHLTRMARQHFGI